MTNDNAFENFILSDDWQEIRLHAQNSDELAEKVWQAAIAYMQEQSEVVGYIDEADDPDECEFFLYEDSGDVACEKCIKLYTTPQRVEASTTGGATRQPLKRLSYDQVEALYDGGSWHDFANAIMDAMQELNK